MDESKPKENKPQDQRRFSQEQYDFLKQCSEEGDEGIKKWNEWRKARLDMDIFLEGQDLSGWYLKEVNLSVDPVGESVIGPGGRVGSVFDLRHTNKIHLEDAVFENANLEDAALSGAHLERARLHANLKGAVIRKAYLENAILSGAVLEGAKLNSAHLQNTRFQDANLKDTIFFYADMKGAKVRTAFTTNITSFWKIQVDRETIFEGVPLDGIRIDPATKQLLEYNIRRKNWEEWYNEHPKLKWIVKPFWWMSDYGLSTGRIIAVFFGLAVIFQNIYYHWGRIAPPGIVDNLFVDQNGVAVPSWLVPLRTLYFSIVTMTTLGFGDMYANAHSIWGHILLSIQVILGYVLLGALVTRFAVLFTAGGPAGRFEDEKKKKDKTKQKAE